MFKVFDRIFTRFASWIAAATGQPLAFVLAVAVVVVWAITGPMFAFSETWQLVINTGTTIITFLMVFLIQNSQNRDTASMQAKLDELLFAIDKARNEFIGIEHLSTTEIERLRSALEEDAANHSGRDGHASVERLLRRL